MFEEVLRVGSPEDGLRLDLLQIVYEEGSLAMLTSEGEVLWRKVVVKMIFEQGNEGGMAFGAHIGSEDGTKDEDEDADETRGRGHEENDEDEDDKRERMRTTM